MSIRRARRPLIAVFLCMACIAASAKSKPEGATEFTVVLSGIQREGLLGASCWMRVRSGETSYVVHDGSARCRAFNPGAVLLGRPRMLNTLQLYYTDANGDLKSRTYWVDYKLLGQ